MTQPASRCKVPRDTAVLSSLPGHHYDDAFMVLLADGDERTAEQLMAARGTGVLERRLARVRDLLVAPFGLKPIGPRAMAPFERLEVRGDEAIFAVDDRHADVRIGYRFDTVGPTRRLTATTLVRVHSTLGWLYLGLILPFHFLIVKRQLNRIARATWPAL